MAARMTYDRRKGAGERFEYRSQTRSWDCWAWGTILGLGGGIAAVVLGSAFTAVAWFEADGSRAGIIGTVLLCAVIPLLVAGALCLDMEERKRKRASRT